MWWVLWERYWNSTLRNQESEQLFSFERDRGRFHGGLRGEQEHWRQEMISVWVRGRRAVYSGRLNSKDERTETLGVISGIIKGESASGRVAPAEVGEGTRCSRCSCKTLNDFNGGRWSGTVKFVDLDENEKCQFSKSMWIFFWRVLHPKSYIFIVFEMIPYVRLTTLGTYAFLCIFENILFFSW